MKRTSVITKWIALAAALLGLAPAAQAQWERLAGPPSGQVAFYYDKQTIAGKGDVRTMWALSDYAIEQDHSTVRVRSMKELYEFNCADKANAWRTVAASYHGQPMGAGPNLVDNPTPRTRFYPLKTDHVSAEYWKIACAERAVK